MGGLSDNCPNCVIGQVYTWGVFMLLLLMAWDSVVPPILSRLYEQSTVSAEEGKPLRRPYLCVLVVYMMVWVYLRILMFAIFAYVFAITLCMAARYAIFDWLTNLILTVANPAAIFNCITVDHIIFHAFVFVAVVLIAPVAVVGYIRDKDTLPNRKMVLRAKMHRILFAIPFVTIISYGMYAGVVVISTMMDD